MAEVMLNSHSHSGSVSEVLLLEFWVVLVVVLVVVLAAVELVAVDGSVPKWRVKRPGGAWVCGGMEEAGRISA